MCCAGLLAFAVAWKGKLPEAGELGVWCLQGSELLTEQGMVPTGGLYSRQGQSISCSSLAQLSEQQHDKSDRMSRSLTCLGLAGSIPEGASAELVGKWVNRIPGVLGL